MLREDGHSSDSSFEEDQAEPKRLVFVTGSSGKLGTTVVKYLSKHHSAKVTNLTNNIYLKYFVFDQLFVGPPYPRGAMSLSVLHKNRFHACWYPFTLFLN